MYCARCRKVIAKHEPRIWAVLPGGSKPLPTCYDDWLCEVRKMPIVIPAKPVIAFISRVPRFVRVRNKIRGWGKYRRRYEFYGRLTSG